MRVAQLIAAGAVVLAFPAGALAQATPPTLTASGTASAVPEPDNRRSETSIRAAVEAAEADALPRAVADARTHATALAAAAGLTLGALISISDAAPTSPYFSFYGPLGTFANGRYCGQVRRTRTVVRDGVRRRVSAGTRRVCRIPPQVLSSVQLTYAVS
jgi:uncharacterized protein YggE